MAMRTSRLLCRLIQRNAVHVSETSIPAFLQTTSARHEPPAGSWDRSVLFTSTANVPAGHAKSDLRDVACNIRLSRMRDITLRRDIRLYDENTAFTLEQIFKVNRLSTGSSDLVCLGQ